MTDRMNDGFLSTREAAAILGVNPMTAIRMIHAGEIVAVRTSGAKRANWKIDASEISRRIAERDRRLASKSVLVVSKKRLAVPACISADRLPAGVYR